MYLNVAYTTQTNSKRFILSKLAPKTTLRANFMNIRWPMFAKQLHEAKSCVAQYI